MLYNHRDFTLLTTLAIMAAVTIIVGLLHLFYPPPVKFYRSMDNPDLELVVME